LEHSQAIATIEEILNARTSSYRRFERDVLLSLGALESFLVDFLIIKNNDTDAVVNYVGYKRDLSEELANQGALDTFGIPNLYLFRLPDDEIKSRLNAFIDNGFN